MIKTQITHRLHTPLLADVALISGCIFEHIMLEEISIL